MRKKVLLCNILIGIAIFLLSMVLIIGSMQTYLENRHISELQTLAKTLSTAIEKNGTAFLEDLSTDTRITVIAADGAVLFDSVVSPEKMENHKERKEIKEAFEKGRGSAERYSKTLMERTVNYAQLMGNGDVIRVSGSGHTAVMLLKNMIFPMLLILLCTVVLALLFSAWAAKSIMRQINEINFENPRESELYDELKPLVKRISMQNEQIQSQMKELTAEHEKQDRMRREFTANVSHELKTPLTSISGFAEIIKSGIVKPEDIGRFAGKIYDEAQRLIILVGDIIKLSKLDDREVYGEKERVSLADTAKEVAGDMSPIAVKNGISLELSGDDVYVMGIHKMIYEIIYNLCDNAVKYGKDGGFARIITGQTDGKPFVAVCDNGIGIEESEIERVFERFYRVEKSHSKDVGGTGLGLSIVKHAAAYHDAVIDVKSKVGEGTEIRIVFES